VPGAMTLDAQSFLLQWAAGGLLFGWVTTRRREVGLGYGWLLRTVYGALAAGAVVLYATGDDSGWGRMVALSGALAVVAGAALALAVSVARRGAGVSGRHAQRARRRARVAAMTDGGDAVDGGGDVDRVLEQRAGAARGGAPREYPPALDLVAPLAGLAGLAGAAELVGGGYALTLARLAAGALLLGAVSDAMLLGHWYLVQPGLRREPLGELVRLTALAWPVHVAVFLLSPGMLQVVSGSVDDGYNGLLGWVWMASAVSTIVLVAVTRAALRERYYSAVMSATGLLYLAILTAFGQDLVARAVLSP
jgi:hypothetical protein